MYVFVFLFCRLLFTIFFFLFFFYLLFHSLEFVDTHGDFFSLNLSFLLFFFSSFLRHAQIRTRKRTPQALLSPRPARYAPRYAYVLAREYLAVSLSKCLGVLVSGRGL